MPDTPNSTTTAAVFGGAVPDVYHRHLGPLLFVPYAQDLARRLPSSHGMRVLEIACGTGIVTRELLALLPHDATLTATDLNEPMLAIARKHVADPRVRWQQADATSLPFDDQAFDAVVCQFGVMFFPDRVKAAREVRRVLQPGGVYLFNVWAGLADNPVGGIAQRVVERLFPENPPGFYKVPWGYFDPAQIERDVRDGGFSDVTLEVVDLPGRTPSAEHAAVGVVQGTPIAGAIAERGAPPIDTVTREVARAYADAYGAGPIDFPLRAIVVTARGSTP